MLQERAPATKLGQSSIAGLGLHAVGQIEVGLVAAAMESPLLLHVARLEGLPGLSRVHGWLPPAVLLCRCPASSPAAEQRITSSPPLAAVALQDQPDGSRPWG